MFVNARNTFKPSLACWKRTVPARGTGTYEYRKRGYADGPNYDLIHFLNQERHKTSVFSKRDASELEQTIKHVHKLDFPIRNVKDLDALPPVGPALTTKLLEFLGSSKKHDFQVVNRKGQKIALQRSAAIQGLQVIPGIGPIKARALVEQGCVSIQQLQMPQYLEMLPPAVRKSLQLIIEDATKEEVEQFMNSFRAVLPSDFEPCLTGSYRREQTRIHSIELLLFHSSYAKMPVPSQFVKGASNSHRIDHATPPPNLLHDAVEPLGRKDVLNALRAGPSKWQGLYKVRCNGKEEFRRLNISLMPQPSKAAALLVSTGDEEFVRNCCRQAARDNMTLNEYGLFRKISQSTPKDYATDAEERTAVDDDTPGDSSDWEFVNTPDEAALLHELGMGYIVPKRRNFTNLLNQSHLKGEKKGEKLRARKKYSQPTVRPPTRITWSRRDRIETTGIETHDTTPGQQ